MSSKTRSHIEKKQEYGAYSSGEEERQITELMLERRRDTVGLEMPSREGWMTEATRDGIRHYAQGMGIDDPLYSDPEYAKNTRWRGIIAPPMLHRRMSIAVEKHFTDEEKLKQRDALAGIHAWYAGEHVQWFRPVHVGDVLTARRFRGDCVEKKSAFAGRTVFDYNCHESWNQRGELVVKSTGYSIRGGRQRKWGERQKYATIEPQTYTAEDIERIDAEYERMEVRGSNPRYWEDVNVGDELTPTVYGPLTISDMLAFASGNGSLMKGSHAHILAYKQRKASPRSFFMNDAGIPDIIEAVHWDNGLSQRTGNPMAYDYGDQRVGWLCHVVTNWMGDDGWLKSLGSEFRRFIYIGDTVYAKGRVSNKEIRNNEARVEIDVWVEDQRGRITAPARAEVILPSRQLGPVQVPPVFEGPPPGWYVQ